MKTNKTRGLALAALVGSLTLAGFAGSANAASIHHESSPANKTHADTALSLPASAIQDAAYTTNGSGSTAGGTQTPVSVTAPVNILGTALSVLGHSTAQPTGVPASTSSTSATSPATTTGTHSIAGGTQAPVSAGVPVTVTGDAISVLGNSKSAGNAEPAPSTTTTPSAGSTSGGNSVGSGTQAPVGVDIPVNANGDAISVLGRSSANGGNVPASNSGTAPTGNNTTTGSQGILGGTQLPVNVNVPVNATGTAVSVLGNSTSNGSTTSASSPSGSSTGSTTTGNNGVASGTQAPIGISVPVTVSGDPISVLGNSNTTGSPASVSNSGTTGTGSTTTGSNGVASGTQAPISLGLPVTLSGDPISVLGTSTATGTSATAPTSGSTSTGSTTTGGGSLLGGTQLPITVSVPVTVSGDPISVLGTSTTGSTTGGTTGSTGGGTTSVNGGGPATITLASDESGSLAFTGTDIMGALLAVMILGGLGLGFMGVARIRNRRLAN